MLLVSHQLHHIHCIFCVAAAYTCSDIQALGSSATAVEASDLSAMTTAEFTDCIETFGGMDDWDEEQLEALATQTKTAYGAVNTWTTEEIQTAGAIVAGLTSDEIGQLDLSSSDVFTEMGAYDIFDSAQVSCA